MENKIKASQEILRGFCIAIGMFLFCVLFMLLVTFSIIVINAFQEFEPNNTTNNKTNNNNSIFEKKWSI